jgi:outer membrane biosynthesis protein TonB
MSDRRAATGFDRLPWLADEPAVKPAPGKRVRSDLTSWVVAVALLIAVAFFWIGTRSQAPETPLTPKTTVPLPQPRGAQEVPIAPQPQVSPAPVPDLRPTPAPEVHFARPSRTIRLTRAEEAEAKRAVAEQRTETEPPQPTPVRGAQGEFPSPPAPVATAPPAARPVPLRPWQPRVVAGAAGRLVQIGAFGSVPQAKRGWWYMVRAYPAVAQLPAVVRPERNSRGRVFYRFRVGTTSQAHSEVLCQRMQRIHFSCAVVGLPWKAKVER